MSASEEAWNNEKGCNKYLLCYKRTFMRRLWSSEVKIVICNDKINLNCFTWSSFISENKMPGKQYQSCCVSTGDLSGIAAP